MKALFPKLPRGGYTVRIRFLDEARGEKYFDTEWGVNPVGPDAFTLFHRVDCRGDNDFRHAACNSIGKELRPGDVVAISVDKHTMRGRTFVHSRSVTITAVENDVNGNRTTVQYEEG